ncbi:hypothetical protein, partial [Aphanothece microscopica]
TAAGTLPQLGLQWTERQDLSLVLIGLAVLVNLALATLARTQTIAALHVVVNLVPLAIVPQSGLTLVIATLVCLLGSRLPGGRRWNAHQLVVTWAYALYHLAWVVRSQPFLDDDDASLRLLGALSAVLVFGGGILLQHQPRWLSPRLQPLPLAVLISQGGALGLALLLYPRQAVLRATVLGLGALTALLLARRSRRNGWAWLELADSLGAQGFAVAAVFSLQPLIADLPLLLLVLQAESLAFLWLGVVEQAPWIRRLGWALSGLSAAALTTLTLLQALAGRLDLQLPGFAASPAQTTSVLLIAALLLAGSQELLHRREVPLPLPPLLGWLAGPPLWVAIGLTSAPAWRPALLLGVIGGLLLLARRWQTPGLRGGLNGAVVALHAQFWLWVLVAGPWSWPTLLPRLLPLTLLALLLLANRQATACRRLGWGLLQGTAAVLTLATIGLRLVGTSFPALQPNAVVLLVEAALFTGLPRLLLRRGLPVPWPATAGWLAPALVLTGTLAGLAAPAALWGAAVALGLLLLLARRWRPAGLLAGSTTAAGLVHLLSWPELLNGQPWAPGALLLRLTPLAALAVGLHLSGRGRDLAGSTPPGRWLGLDLLGLTLGLAAHLLFQPVSPLIPGVAWLLLALLWLEAADRLPGRDAAHALGLAGLNLLAYVGAYLLVISQSPAIVELGPLSLRGRLLIELLAVLVLLYGWFFRPRPVLAELKLWERLQPSLLEGSLLATAALVLSEVGLLWRPVAWSFLALVLISPPLRRLFASRLQVYAVILFWLGLATLVAMLGTLPSPSPHWAAQPQTLGLLAIGLQVGFIVAAHRWLDPDQLRHPGGLALLTWIGRRVAPHPFRWLYLPLFAAVAYYLASRYDRSLLTLLWAAEAFGIYVLGAVLREPPFRTIALIGLGACLVRLVAIDMAQADLGLRGLVFVGVGGLMLAINAIASRFRSRFE